MIGEIGTGQSIFRLRAEGGGDRSVYSLLEWVLPSVTVLFACLILLGKTNWTVLGTWILGHLVLNVCCSVFISRYLLRHSQVLEGAKDVFNAAYVFVATLAVGPGSFFWTLHYLVIVRTMLVFPSRRARMGVVFLLASTAAAAEFLLVGSLAAALQPMVLLMGPALLIDTIFRFFEGRLIQERDDRLRAESAVRLLNRMEAVGGLAAGIAHEINTPVQYVSDSLIFVRRGVRDLLTLRGQYCRLMEMAMVEGSAALEEQKRVVGELEGKVDAPYLLERIPRALERMTEGLGRVSEIVSSVRRISHPGADSSCPEDLNESIRATVRVTTSAWKGVAEVRLRLGDLPMVECHIGELHQVFLNLLVNSADAIRERPIAEFPGLICIETRCLEEEVEILVADNGYGIDAEHLGRVFDPFFTTKKAGSGTGQGLAMAHTVICERHGGTISLESKKGRGTTVQIRLPISTDGGLDVR